MQIEVNGQLKNVPSDISTISIGQFISWYDEYGRDLDTKLQEIFDAEYDDELQREFAIEDHIDQEALAWFSFFTECDFLSIKAADAELITTQYRFIRLLLKESEKTTVEFPHLIEWKGDKWMIQNWRVDPKSKMNFNEVITSKEIMRQINKVSGGRWQALQYLCAVFLRYEGEEFRDEFVHEGSERMNMMLELPLNIAMNVGFFLSSCVNTWLTTLASSEEVEEEMLSQI